MSHPVISLNIVIAITLNSCSLLAHNLTIDNKRYGEAEEARRSSFCILLFVSTVTPIVGSSSISTCLK
jgi:hypothetical protein